MDNEAFNQLLDDVSPKHYRQFRRLYNELLGYMRREEYDKIKEFQHRLDQQMVASMELQMALKKRLDAIGRQKNEVQKQLLHQQFRQPKVSIMVTHPFPCKDLTKSDAVVEDVPEVVSVSNLEHERKIDEVIHQMKEYDQQTLVDESVIDDVDESGDVSVDLNATVDGEASIRIPSIEPTINDEPDSEGDALPGDFFDDELTIRSRSNHDSNQHEIESKDSVQKTVSSKPSSSDVDSDSSPQNRKERIKQYIEKDQSSGDISSEL